MTDKPLKENDLMDNRYTEAEAKIRPCVEKSGRRRKNSGAQPFGGEEATQWLQILAARRYRQATIRAYAGTLGQLGVFLVPRGRTRASDVTESDLTAWLAALAERGTSSNTILSYTKVVRLWFSWLEAQGHLFLNPAAELILHRERKLLPAPTQAQISALLAVPDVARPLGLRDRAILETMYATAARREEMLRLNLADLDLDNATMRVTGKGGHERVLPLTTPAVKWLSEYIQTVRPRLLGLRLNEEALWIDRMRKRLDAQALVALVKTHAKTAGVTGISPHALRRACATHLLQNGAHPVQVQTLLGHVSLRSLRHYLRLTIQDVQAMHRKTKPGK